MDWYAAYHGAVHRPRERTRAIIKHALTDDNIVGQQAYSPENRAQWLGQVRVNQAVGLSIALGFRINKSRSNRVD